MSGRSEDGERSEEERPEPAAGPEALPLRDRLIGLGERSHRKSYYPELQQRLAELERFRVLLDQSLDGILLFQLPDGRLLDLNQAARALLALGDGPHPDTALLDLLPEPARAGAAQALRGEAAEPFEVTVAGRRLDLTLRPATFHGQPFALLTVRDVTARAAADHALRESEQRLRTLFLQAPEAILVADLSGAVLEANPAALESLGCTPDEVRSWSIFGREDRTRLAKGAPWPAPPGVTLAFETEYQRRDGTDFPVEVRAAVLVQDGRPQLLAFVRDLSERRRLQEALRQKDEQLARAQRLEALGRLAGGVAHDFNNLLTVILGFTSGVLEAMPPEDPARAELSEVLGAAGRASDLTRQLLAFGRRQILQPKAVDVNAVVGSIERMLRRLIGEHIAFATDLAPEAGHVFADPGQLEQVLVNLVVNARDAMPGGGTLTVSTRRCPAPPAEAAAPEGPCVELAVRDTGIGMDAATRARVFEPFFTTKALGRGTGLGLSTVYGIVRQSGGQVLVESEPGHGTVFRVLLPCASPSEGAEPAGGAAPEATGGAETVLVVEDDALVLRLVCETLRASGYRLLSAPDAVTALERSRAHPGPIDLLVTDVVMPSVSGLELADQLAAARPEAQVLFISGYSEDGTALQRRLGERYAFLAKPFTPAQLREAARLSLARAGAR